MTGQNTKADRQVLAAGYGRDYSWLGGALELYAGQIKAGPGAAVVSFVPGCGLEKDMGWQYGLAAGLRLHFLLEDTAAPQELAGWAQLLPEQPDEKDWYCIPVKTGRPALGWQLGLRLGAVRPLVLLRPFYLFRTAAALAVQGQARRVPGGDIRRLGRLLDEGWAGVELCQPAGEFVLRRRVQSGPLL